MAYGNVFNLGQEMTAGQRYQAGQLAIGEQQNVIANRKKANEIRQMYDQMPDQIEQLEAQGLFDQASQVRDNYLKTQINSIRMMESVGHMVSPEDYQEFRSQMVRSGAVDPKLMPVQWSENWWRPEVERQKGKISKLTRQWYENGVVMSQDLLTQDGKIKWKGAEYPDPKANKTGTSKRGGGSGSDRLKSSDSNAIASATASLFGGLYDPQTGRITGLSKDEQQRVLSLAEEAERIFAVNPSKGHRQAAAEAARNAGINIDRLSEKPKDPLNLLGDQ